MIFILVWYWIGFGSFLKSIFYHAKKAVTAKFPEASDIIVGVFYFLRFLLPAIVTPTAYGLLQGKPNPPISLFLSFFFWLLYSIDFFISFNQSLLSKSITFLSILIPHIFRCRTSFRRGPKRVDSDLQTVTKSEQWSVLRQHRRLHTRT